MNQNQKSGDSEPFSMVCLAASSFSRQPSVLFNFSVSYSNHTLEKNGRICACIYVCVCMFIRIQIFVDDFERTTNLNESKNLRFVSTGADIFGENEASNQTVIEMRSQVELKLINNVVELLLSSDTQLNLPCFFLV